jgi:hypothetical protein
MASEDKFTDRIKAQALLAVKKINLKPEWPEGVDPSGYPPVLIAGVRFSSFENYQLTDCGRKFIKHGCKLEDVSDEEKLMLTRKGILPKQRGKFTPELP